MNHSKEQDDRWGELAELLGLPPEKSTAKAAPAPAAPPAPPKVEAPPTPPVPEPKIEIPEPPPPAPLAEVETAHMEPIPEETGANWEEEFESDDDATTVDEAGQLVDEVISEEEPSTEPGAAPPLGEDGQPRRGRRRRRRGRRRGKEGAEGEPRTGDVAAAAPAAPVEPRELAQPSQRPDRPPQREREPDMRDSRGRGRGRGRGRREDEEPRRSSPPPQQPQYRDEPEFVDDEVVSDQPGRVDVPFVAEDTDFSNWNVPSWQELISGLHRPDR